MAPETFWTIVAGVFGLLVGSFLNVCVFRVPRDCMSIVHPRSRCTRCLRPIAWYDNFPVFSWLALGGRCRGCRARISARYPLVEALTGAAFVYLAGSAFRLAPPVSPAFQVLYFGVTAYLVGAMIVSTLIDLDFQILPDEITISGVILGLAVGAVFPEWHARGGRELPTELLGNAHMQGLTAAAVGALAGGGSIYVVGVLGKLLFRKEAMGFGDVKYMAFLGAFLGWKAILLTFMVACLYGSVFGIGKFVFSRRMGYVPFGPFLSAGAATMLFAAVWVYRALDWYVSLFQPAEG